MKRGREVEGGWGARGEQDVVVWLVYVRGGR